MRDFSTHGQSSFGKTGTGDMFKIEHFDGKNGDLSAKTAQIDL
jgi:hypothetical protein